MAGGDIDEMIVINMTDFAPANPAEVIGRGLGNGFTVVQSLEQAQAVIGEDRVTQAVCPWNFGRQATDLRDYQHETDWYVFGPAIGWGGHDMGSDKITIPVPDDTPMFSVQAAAVIFSHRYATMKPSL